MSILVRDVMRAAPHTISPDEPASQLERLFLDHKVGGLPVIDEGSLVGMACRSDIVRALGYERTHAELMAESHAGAGGAFDAEVGSQVGARLQTLTVGDVMVHDVKTAAPDEAIEVAARHMTEAGIHRLPVVDGGKLVGIVTSADLMRLVADGRLTEPGEGTDGAGTPLLGHASRLALTAAAIVLAVLTVWRCG